MAWIKEIEIESTGVIVSFWEVVSVFYDHKKQVADLVVGGWISKQAFDDNKSAVVIKNWSVPAGAAPELSFGAVAFVAAYAKAQDMFDGFTEAT